MIDFIENYTNPKTEFRIYFAGTPLKIQEPVKPDTGNPVVVKDSTFQLLAETLKLYRNEYGKVEHLPLQKGAVVGMRYKGKSFLVTAKNDEGEGEIINL